MSAIILGSDGFTHNGLYGLALTSRRRTRSPVYGLGWHLTFSGTAEAVNRALLNLPDDVDGESEESGPIHYLHVRYTTDPSGNIAAAVTNTYELLGNSLQKDIREHPKALNLSRPTMDKIEEVLRITEPSDDDLAAIGTAGSNARMLYDYMRQRNGSAAYQVSQFVFRVTSIISRRAQIDIAYANQNKLYTFAQLLSETNPPSGYALSLSEIQEQCEPSNTPDGYLWRWLKQAPTVTTAAGNRLAIQTEFLLEEWSTFVYESA